MPSTKRVFIDNTPYNMSQYIGNDPKVGIWFIYQIYGKDLGGGSHNYFFHFKDGNGGEDFYPEGSQYIGPDVSMVPDIRIEPLTLNFKSGNTISAGLENNNIETNPNNSFLNIFIFLNNPASESSPRRACPGMVLSRGGDPGWSAKTFWIALLLFSCPPPPSRGQARGYAKGF